MIQFYSSYLSFKGNCYLGLPNVTISVQTIKIFLLNINFKFSLFHNLLSQAFYVFLYNSANQISIMY